MSPAENSVLTINGGSSSIKFALYQTGSSMQRSLTGIVDRIGSSGTTLTYSDTARDRQESLDIDVADHTLPCVARLLPIPHRFDAAGIRRHGFHGLSYAYLMQELAQVAGTQAAQGCVILAHLGNGASLAAVRGGRSINTSMGFTPSGGLPMGTRTGDLDPGVAWYLMQSENLAPEQFNQLINHESGLLGVSETSSDMREIEEARNAANASVISERAGRIVVRVMHTDEEVMIAKSVCRVLNLPTGKEKDHG